MPLIREIQGRTTDFVLAADGTVMHGLAVIYILRDLPGVQSFKIVQHDLMHTTVQVVPGSEFGPVQEQAIRTGIRRRLGESVRVAIERVQTIAPEKSGKFRYVVSHAAPQSGSAAVRESPTAAHP